MIVSAQKNGRTLIVEVSGELDHHTSELFKDELENYLKKYAVKNVILDFAKLNFMDSSGIGVILGRYRQIKSRGGLMGAVGLNSQMRRIFTISGLDKIIDIYAERQEALDTFEGGVK